MDALKSASAFTDYAIQGFNYDRVIDYLHKPIRFNRFIKAIERLKKQIALEKGMYNSMPAITSQEEQTKTFLTVQEKKTIYKIPLSSIIYLEACGNYVKIFTESMGMKIIRITLAEMESQLPENLFLRIHKSFIVNILKVHSLSGNTLKTGEAELPVGKCYSLTTRKKITGEI